MIEDLGFIKEQLRQLIDKKASELLSLQEAYRSLQTVEEKAATETTCSIPRPATNRYQGGKLRDHITDRLMQVGHPMTRQDLVNDLLAGGAYLGKDPKRMVAMLSITVTQNRQNLAFTKDMLVTLREWEEKSDSTSTR